MLVIVLNALAIVLGTGIGIGLKKLVREDAVKSILKVLGVLVIIVSLTGILEAMVIVNDGKIDFQFELLLLVTISLGALSGELLKLEDKFLNFQDKIEKKVNTKRNLTKGFFEATLLFCVGALAIVGTFNAATGDPSLIYLKTVLDFVSSILLSATLGIGVVFSSVIVFLYQGIMFVVFYYSGSMLTNEFINVISLVGYVIILCMGINFISGKKIKIMNLLPALLFAIIYYLVFYYD
ncbi:MAG: DUF554 domain-containing protein [Bacilli bacterium]|jgi:hypothetical protein|nr:DUF554 domain-containing protein [Bacilli bacterium]MDD3121116.1 DUF554 domain-containing protein [Bacilli bacterium]MDD4063389.1 DUF554 domain-containing protein [Bacilli bacterium]MDD5182930.1 DUF554 domain-containing protein [Bacilli bacterium]MDY0363275.1 DUF554 domain-containing protein [Bacilli bacterium]